MVWTITVQNIHTDLINDLRSVRVNDPLFGAIVGVLVAINRQRVQTLSGLPFRQHISANLFAGVLCIPFVDDVPKRREVIVYCAVRVYTVVDGNEANVQIRKADFRIHTDFQIVTTEPRHILHNDHVDAPGFNIRKHFLKARAVEVRSGITVIFVDFEVRNSMIARVLAEDFNLMRNAVAVAL